MILFTSVDSIYLKSPKHLSQTVNVKVPFHFSISERDVISPSECCMSGCAICVYDLYQDAMNTYNQSLESLRISFSNLQIPECEWPINVRDLTGTDKGGRRVVRDVSLSAFEELENSLREQREKHGGREVTNQDDTSRQYSS
jgi:Oxidoreductase-like protein, N-terminal